MADNMRGLADRLFGLFEKQEWKAALCLFDEDAVIKQHFGTSQGKPVSLAEFETALTSLVSVIGTPKYLNRRVSTFADGFVEQHTTQLTNPRGAVRLEACLVVRTNASGRIVFLEEYLDPSPLMAGTKSGKSKKTAEATQGDTGAAVDRLGPGVCCVITGAGSGIGEEIALEYAKHGCSVVLAGRRADRLESVAARCRKLNPECKTLSVPTDVAVPEQCVALVDRAVAAFGPLARLVLNAGVSQNATLLESGPKLVREQMEINFFGAVNTVSAALPHMLELSCPGVKPRVVVVSSALGLLSAPKNTGYASSKAALHGFFDSLRSEVGDRVSISLVAPGPVNTPILQSLSGPQGTRVALDLDAKTLSDMVTATEAARLTVQACEEGKWLFVFPPLDKLVSMRARDPEKVASIMNAMYAKSLKTVAAKL
eukprot:TRINITY_DN42930_c0_g1_i1.p1 TRINITY_DN42930_c0_g1~~TRINITY_DN42930_c0_g1_i1.p1  ORF type:complete len:444 (+),score=72.34 TRINITY_DN42930_c0_g1_i1:54-1334(+)